MGEKVYLHVYDLSLGVVSQLSKDLLGVQIDGFWHTGVVLHGYEYFYGKTVHRKKPADFEKMFGRPPVEKIFLGNTNMTKREFEAAITSQDMQEKYSAETYDILKNNCNNFSTDAIKFALPDTELSEEVITILENTKAIIESPSSEKILGYLRNGRNLGVSFLKQLIPRTSGNDQQTIRTVLDIFNRPSALDSTSDAATLDLDEEEEEEADDMDKISPEAAISGLLDFFESFSTPEKPIRPPSMNHGSASRAQLPPGAQDAAMNFGRNLVDALKLINTSIASAVETRNVRTKNTREKPRHVNSVMEEVHDSDTVPLRDDVREFLSTTFDSPDEVIVLKTVSKVLETNGYYEMSALKGITEGELSQMGIKRGWAKKICIKLENYFHP